MLTRLWRVFVATLAIAMFGVVAASTAAAQTTITVNLGPIAVPGVPAGEPIAEVCVQQGEEEAECTPIETPEVGPSTIRGTLTVTVETPSADVQQVPLTCPEGQTGVGAGVSGATGSGNISAEFEGEVTPAGGTAFPVQGSAAQPIEGTEPRTVGATVCVLVS